MAFFLSLQDFFEILFTVCYTNKQKQLPYSTAEMEDNMSDEIKTESMDDYKEELEASFQQIRQGAEDKDDPELLAWNTLREYMENKTVLQVKIGGIVNKGVVVYVEGIRGFIPASKLAATYVENTEEWLNRTVDAIVITADEEEKRLVLSAKEPAMKKLAEENAKKAAAITTGSVVEGTVESLQPYGAFVALESGVTGLLHISQISDKRIKSPSVVLSVGQKITVKVISTDNGKISLSMKALLDVAAPEEEALDYELPQAEEVGTGLGALLKNIRLS